MCMYSNCNISCFKEEFTIHFKKYRTLISCNNSKAIQYHDNYTPVISIYI